MNIKIRREKRILNLLHKKSWNFWAKEREKRALKIFHEAAIRVPAYKNFLKKNRINSEHIRTFKDFQKVPTTSKQNYLKHYPIESLPWDGTLKKPLVFTSTSGSTGKPFYFPRGHRLDWEYSILAEFFLKNSSYKSGGPVLVIIGFGMGVWIGGLITYQAFEIAGNRGYPISIITPGINKKEIFNALKNLSPHYKETIFIGYPPFLKDILDEAPDEGINLKKINFRVLSAAEAYTEKFREYIVKKGGIKNLYLDTLNIYGTADIGAMAWETPTAILIRRLAMKDPHVFQSIFSKINKTPTLAQYNPLFITFEEKDGEIILTGNNTIPLIRYAVGDHGGITTFSEIIEKLKKHKIDFYKEAKAAGIENHITQLPFVYVYERNDFSTTLYGLQIYSETIREVLIDEPLDRFLTGKFSMATKFNNKQDQYLEINLELRKNRLANKRLEKLVLSKIMSNLELKNSEFKELHQYLGDRALPRLIFWPAEHALHFKLGVKQKWVKK